MHKCYPIGVSDTDPAIIVERAEDPHNAKTSNTEALRAFGKLVIKHRDKVHGGPTIGWVVAADRSCAEVFKPENIAKIRNKKFLIILSLTKT